MSTKLWRVFVEGPTPVVNGYGVHVQITQVRFDGYYEEPPKPSAPDPQPADRAADLSEGRVSYPKLIYQVDPEFTERARKAHIEGEVTTMMVIDETGKPRDVRVIHGLGYGLDEEAIKAVYQYKFKPAQRNGEPVPATMSIAVNFQRF